MEPFSGTLKNSDHRALSVYSETRENDSYSYF